MVSCSFFSISASDIFSAIRSPSINDDEAIIQKIFSGDDLFDLSDEDDVIDGYAGTIILKQDWEMMLLMEVQERIELNSLVIIQDYQITHNALENKFTITGSNETKTVTNVEQFDFNDVSYSSNELKEKINPIDTYTPPSSGNNSGATLLSNEGFNINNFNFYSLVSWSANNLISISLCTSFNTSNDYNDFMIDAIIRGYGYKRFIYLF